MELAMTLSLRVVNALFMSEARFLMMGGTLKPSANRDLSSGGKAEGSWRVLIAVHPARTVTSSSGCWQCDWDEKHRPLSVLLSCLLVSIHCYIPALKA